MTRANDDAAAALAGELREMEAAGEPARELSGYAVKKIRDALKAADDALREMGASKLPHYQREKARDARVLIQSSWAEVAPRTGAGP